MLETTFFFYAFAALTLIGAILTVSLRNPVHSALGLILSLLSVAGLFLLQRAEFLFAVQIVLYVGGIMLLFLFVIMLVNLDEQSRRRQFSRQWPIAMAALILLGAEFLYLINRGLPKFPAAPPDLPAGAPGNTERLADVLFSSYLLPFEVASLLLLVAIVGSVLLARKKA